MIFDFYNSVFPPIGLRALAVFKDGLKKAPTHSFYDNNDDLLEAAGTYNTLGKNVYHGCAVYKTADNRKGENVLACKSLWLDQDVGPTKPYASQREAVTDYETFRAELGLPKSHIVSSGGGIHQYHAFTKAITPDNWDRVAAVYAACMDHYGVKHDTSRTQDKASILRIPGTGNFKTNPAKAVVLKRLGEETSAQDLYRILKAYADANGLIVGAPKAKGKPAVTNNMIGNDTNHSPSEGPIIAQHCPIINEIESSGGDVGYEVWWRALGVAKHTTNPEVVAADWTRNRASTGHAQDDWKGLMDAWSTGPTLCTEFAKHSPQCANCHFKGKVVTPLHLGTPAQPTIANVQHLAPSPTPVAGPARPLAQPWEFMAQWVIDATGNATNTAVDPNTGAILKSTQQPDGTYTQRPFCDRYWQLMKRVRTAGNVWQLEIGYLEYMGKPFKTFNIDSATVASAELLKKEFAAHELHIYGVKSMDKAQEILRYQQNLLGQAEMETPTYPTLGWATEEADVRSDPVGGIVIGTTMINPKPEPKREVLLGPTVSDNVRRAFRTKGTTAEWVSLIDHIYNRKGAEAYQFIIASAFASPLVSLVPGGGEWHGIPIVVTGDSGAAKTTTCLVAMSVYGYGQNLKFNASEGQGDTINALSVKLGSLRNLPCVLDEMSGLSAEKIANIFAMLANGSAKDRMNQQGQLIKNPYFWDMISLVNTNDKLHEVLEGLRSQYSAQAMQLRSFEISLHARDLRTVFKGVGKTMVEANILDENYGCVGRDWLQFVVNNRALITQRLGDERKKYMIDPDDTSAIRFYKDLLITVKIAASLAKSKGFIQWDVAAMIRWAEKELLNGKDSISTVNWEATISDFIGGLHGRTIVTKYMKMGPGRRTANPEIPQEPIGVNILPVARRAVDDKRFVFTANCLKEWANKNRVLPTTMLAEMLARGYMKVPEDGQLKPVSLNIGGGTTISRGQAPCYEFAFDKVAYSDSEDAADMSNVVQLQSVTEVVTTGLNDEGAASATP